MITQTMTDADLVERFATRREDAAFTELVERHGPRVLRVCRRFLPNEHDAEEVSQATFLLLARKLGSVCWNESVDGWLCAVARRLALSARARTSRRHLRERPFATLGGDRPQAAIGLPPERYHPPCDPLDEIHLRDQSRILRGALGQLPEKYRAALELCYLEGKTNAEAARELGWPTGSMSRRLHRARSLLRHRLVRMGFLLAVCVTCVAYAFMRTPSDGQRIEASAGRLRLAMQAFRSPSKDQVDLETMLQRIARSGQVTQPREQVGALSCTAGWVAAQAAREIPGRNSQLWLKQVESMRLASLDLGQAVGSGDDWAVVEAARRLDATCLACHEVFRP